MVGQAATLILELRSSPLAVAAVRVERSARLGQVVAVAVSWLLEALVAVPVPSVEPLRQLSVSAVWVEAVLVAPPELLVEGQQNGVAEPVVVVRLRALVVRPVAARNGVEHQVAAVAASVAPTSARWVEMVAATRRVLRVVAG